MIGQDTGWSRYVPAGRGLLAFTEIEGAVESLEAIEAEPEYHARAARAVAQEYFDSRRVLTDLLEEVQS